MKDRPGKSDYVCGYCGRPFRRYASDIAAADRAAVRRGLKPAAVRYCSRECSNLANPRFGRPTGYMKPGLEATEAATPLDIAWAAGIYEGEGNCSSTSLQVTQKDPWILERLRALFGGSVHPRKGRNEHCHHWTITGDRKRWFMLVIYDSLSPRRQEQIRNALAGEAARAAEQKARRVAAHPLL